MLLDALKWQPSFSSLLDLMLFLLLCNPESPQWRWNVIILSTSTRSCVFTQYYCRGCSLQPSVQLTSSPRWGAQVQCTPYLTQASTTKMLSSPKAWPHTFPAPPSDDWVAMQLWDKSTWLADSMETKVTKEDDCSWNRGPRLYLKQATRF